MNEWLNKRSENNWEISGYPGWDWGKEIVVIIKGSSGIVASISKQILYRNLRTTVVIVDYAPMTWTAKPATYVTHLGTITWAVRSKQRRRHQDSRDPTQVRVEGRR